MGNEVNIGRNFEMTDLNYTDGQLVSNPQLIYKVVLFGFPKPASLPLISGQSLNLDFDSRTNFTPKKKTKKNINLSSLKLYE